MSDIGDDIKKARLILNTQSVPSDIYANTDPDVLKEMVAEINAMQKSTLMIALQQQSTSWTDTTQPSLIDTILKMHREIPKPELSLIIIVRYGIPENRAIKWTKHGGIMWINDIMWREVLQQTVVHYPERPTVVSSLLGVPVEYYLPELHGDLWFEFIRDYAKDVIPSSTNED